MGYSPQRNQGGAEGGGHSRRSPPGALGPRQPIAPRGNGMTHVVELKDVHKRFGSNQVLKGVSFAIPRGQVVAIIGKR